jgi:nucleotide-binding universal stress UspA family protein
MMLPSVILVPTDFGRASQAALDYAVELAQRFGSKEVVLLHAYEIPIVSFPDGAIVATAEMTSRIVDAATYELEKTAQRASASSGVSVRPLLREGDPWHAVLKVTDEVGAGLVVLGTHGRHGVARMLIGSVAERVVRTSKVPVLTVHGGDVPETAGVSTPSAERNGRAAPAAPR